MRQINPKLAVIAGVAAKVGWLEYPAPDIIYSQRCLHCRNYPQALELLSTLSGRRPAGTGRFAELAPKIDRRCHIKKPLCLYAKDAPRLLVAEDGLAAREIRELDYGNVKIIADPTA